LLEYGQFYWNKNANEIINCDEFFNIADTVRLRAFITYDCTVFPNIKGGYLCIPQLLKSYPPEAEKYQISGIVNVYALIDKEGNLYCYSIKTELGDLFIRDAESILKKIEFEKAVCSGRQVAYMISFPIKYEFPKGRKEKRLERKIKKHAL